MFTDENTNNIPHLDAKHNNNLLHGISITPEKVKEKLDEFMTNNSVGPRQTFMGGMLKT